MNSSTTLSPVRIRISITVFFFTSGLCFASWASRIPDIKSILQLSDATLGTVLFSLPAGLMVSLLFSGWMVTRFGSRRTLIIGNILYAATLTFTGLATSAWQLAAVLFVFGLWGNLINIAVNTQAVNAEVIYGRSIMASFHGAWSLAGFTGAAIGFVVIASHVPPYTHFCIIVATVLCMIFLSYRNLLADTVHPESQPIFVKPDKQLLRLGFLAFLGMACEGAMFDWSGVYFQKTVHTPPSLTILGYVAFMSTMTGGRFIGDYLSNRLGRKKMLQLSGILIASGLSMAVVDPSIITATAGFLLVGFGTSSVIPLVYGAAGRSPKMSPGLALAAVSTVGFLGFLLGPPVIGWIAEVANLRYSFALIAVLGFCIALLASKARLVE